MRVLTIIVVIGFLTVSSTQAASATWDGGGTNSTWTTSNNWNPNTALVPAIDFDLFFGGNTRLINTNNFTAGSNFRNITFNNRAGAFVLNGNAITLNGSITNNENTAQTINLDMALSAGTHNVDAAAADIILGGTLSGASGGVTKIGANTLTLTGTNTYGGATVISEGTLQVGTGGATGTLGTGNVTNNAALAFNRNNAMTVSNAISGTGSLTQSGTGTTILTGANTYTNTTTVSAGTLQIGAGGTAGTLGSGNVVNNSALVFNRSDAMTVGNVISGSGSLNQSGAGTTTLTNANTYSGATTINAGTLQIGNGGTGGTLGTGNVTNNAALVFNRNNAVTVGNVISGSGSVTKLGTNTLTLTGANTYSGETAIRGGVLVASNTLALQNSTLNYTNNSGAMIFGRGATAYTLGGLAGDKGLALTNMSGTAVALTVGNNASNTTYSGVLSAGGSLIKTGAGTLTLTGTNTYSGATTINAGTLQIGAGGTAGTLGTGNVTNNAALTFDRSDALTVGNLISGSGSLDQSGAGMLTLTGANTYSGDTTIGAGRLVASNALALQNSTLNYTNNGGTLSFGGGSAAYTFGGLEGDKGLALTNMSGTAITLTVGNNASNTTYGGALSGAGGSLIKTGAGTLTLTGMNTCSGETAIRAGTLVASNALALQNSTLSYTNNGGALAFGRGDTAYTLGGLEGDKGLALTNMSGTAIALTVGNNASNTTYGGALSAGGSLIKTGAGTLTLTGTNTYSGATTISAGTLQIGAGGTTGTLGTGNVTNNAVLAFNRNNAVTVGNVISGSGSVTKLGTNALTLTAANTYNGETTIRGGALVASNTLALQNSTLNYTNNSGAMIFGRGATAYALGGLAGDKNLALTNMSGTAIALTVGNNASNTTYSGVLSAGGSLIKTGAGTLSLTASNTYTGGTTIDGGVLSINRDANLGAATGTLTFANGGALKLVNTGIVYMTRAITLNSGGGEIIADDPLYLSGNITGGGGLAHNGGDDLILNRATGSNNIGAITVSGGRLFVMNTLGNIYNSSISVSNGAILDFSIAGALAPTNKMTFASGSGLSTRLGTLTIDTANVTLPSEGTMIFNRDDLNTTKIIVKGNYPALTGDLAIQVGGEYAGIPGAVTLTGSISGDHSLNKTASGTLVLSGTNTFSGLTTISEGTLVAANALALQNSTLDYNTGDGTLAFGGGSTAYTLGGLAGDKNIALTNAGGTAIALTVGNNSDDTIYSGALSAGGSLIKTGEGILTLTGTNTYSGGTTISVGTLQVGNGGTSGTLGSGNVVNNSELVFDRSDAVTVGNVISGSGSLTKSGTNTLTLTAASTYTNTTFVSSGRLIVNGSLQSRMIEVSSGAILSGTGTVQAVTLDPGAFLTAAGDGQGTLNFTGEMVLSGGSTNFMQILSDSLYDVIKGTGGNTLTATGSFVFDFTGNTTVAEGSTYTVLQNWSSIVISGATFATKGLDPLLSVDTSKLASDGVIQVIPEPAVVSLIGLGGLLTLLGSRLRRRRV